MSKVVSTLLIQPSPLGENFLAGRVLTGSSSYTTGGVAVPATSFGLQTLKWAASGMLTESGTYVLYGYVNAGSKTVTYKWTVFATGAEVANATDLSAQTFRAVAIGN